VILIDTNALLRFLQTNDNARPVVLRAFSHLQLAGEDIVIVPQNLYEFWVVATRPTLVNGFGWTAAECETRIAELKQVFDLLPDPPGLYDAWQRLVIAHDCKGKVAHDTRLVAAMQLHGINRILTFNGADFARFPTITVVEPASVTP
jgi:predicted nucleic acid-binding protein